MAENGPQKIRTSRWIGIVLVLVVGGAVAAWAASLPDSPIGAVIAVGIVAFIVFLVVARFIPDDALGGRVGRARDRNR